MAKKQKFILMSTHNRCIVHLSFLTLIKSKVRLRGIVCIVFARIHLEMSRPRSCAVSLSLDKTSARKIVLVILSVGFLSFH